jgi:hypothetical protein
MWLLTTFIAAFIASCLWLACRKRYSFDKLSLMLWGATIMILVDHILGYEGGAFLESKTDGLIANAAILGIAMLVPVLLIWLIFPISSCKLNKIKNKNALS